MPTEDPSAPRGPGDGRVVVPDAPPTVAGGAWWLAGGVLLPLAVFALLAASVGAGPLAFDLPLLGIAQGSGGGRLDAAWALVSRLGYEWGVVPFDLALVAALLLLRRWRAALFAAIALGGSGLLNVGAKLAFGRVRPELWESIAPEQNFSFPSGHAMGSMTLACVLALLLWRTRWRRPAIVGLGLFVAAVGWSRIHLGVHYPSDILAGWALGLAWTVAWWIAFSRGARAA
ncbi:MULTISPECIES: phosphatase PAP2 family protein [unclassified Luteimonas]|uniref:phosphatase PAP2 family protein n=1 Tax=unclassified Luteimonas TaxID=2629088 RepID=UPI001F1D460D|nr:phosphatase PAP2 family protein [Luteimonas sp. MC1750]